MSTTLERLIFLMKNKGYKLTPQRRYILDAVMENNESHLSIDEIYTVVKQTCPEIGIATIYRTVQMLEEIGVLTKHHFDDGCSRYELADDSKRHNHHHLVCVICGKVIEIQDNYFDELEQHIEKDKNFTITNHTVTFYGKCEICK
ncbi:transcriptional repressor [Alkalibaculum sp. M08DMB]|uniref:Transcriptional repressor n=1 Tax=Alkalibaculum sporogenes TaxID=2655001 RepID=A0A6A7KAU8_9FIRM|nr:Fur family transcriptional regulator [Alkalibaculum sporogenes]MPW26307.1 transcriptional repressor [Alkalibaculum sporogenes]